MIVEYELLIAMEVQDLLSDLGAEVGPDVAGDVPEGRQHMNEDSDSAPIHGGRVMPPRDPISLTFYPSGQSMSRPSAVEEARHALAALAYPLGRPMPVE